MSNLRPMELYIVFPLNSVGNMAWHSRLAAPGGVDGLGRERPWDVTEALTPDQSEAMGFPFNKLVKEINAEALKERDTFLAANQALQTDNDRLERELEAVRQELQALRAPNVNEA